MEEMDNFLKKNIESDKTIKKFITRNKKFDKFFALLNKYPHFFVIIPILLITIIQIDNYSISGLFLLTLSTYIEFIVSAAAIKFVLDLRGKNVNFKNCMLTSFFFTVINFFYPFLLIIGLSESIYYFIIMGILIFSFYFVILWSVFSVTTHNLQIKDLLYSLLAIWVASSVINGLFGILTSISNYTATFG